MNEIDSAAIRTRLETQLAELEQRAARITGQLEQPLDPDFAERAAETHDDEALRAEEHLVLHEIASLRRALDRIAAGTYGQCVRCGDSIAPDRLVARPEAALCIACARTEI